MFQNYSNLLKKAFDAMTSLSSGNASASDYFCTVGYEFLVLIIGLCYIAVVAFIIAAPYGGCYVIFQKFLANHPWKEYRAIKQKYLDFFSEYETTLFAEYERLKKESVKNGAVTHAYNVCNFFEKHGIDTEKARDKIAEFADKETSPSFFDLLKAGGLYLKDADTKEDIIVNTNDFGRLFSPSKYGKKYTKKHIFFNDNFAGYMKFCYVTKAVFLCITFIAIYLMLLIPLILIFVG